MTAALPDDIGVSDGTGSVSGYVLSPKVLQDAAATIGVRPSKSLGQNFVHDSGTVRKIVRAADLVPGERVLEIGPGLGSLTGELLATGHPVVAVEIDPPLAELLPKTLAPLLSAADPVVSRHRLASVPQPTGFPNAPQAHPRHPGASVSAGFPPTGGSQDLLSPRIEHSTLSNLVVINKDALELWPSDISGELPTALVANLPYNVAVPIVLTLLERFPTLRTALVMVQAEVADRLAAAPGSKVYGVPSAKVAWYASARRSLPISRMVFWPVPNVDSALVAIARREPPSTSATRTKVFSVIDAAFAQRRKTLRAALSGIFGGGENAEKALIAAGIDPKARGETLDITRFAKIAEQLGSTNA